jgi:hypothetical protein
MPPDAKSADTGWLPINGLTHTLGSTSAPNLPGRLAVDNEMRTWWQPAEGDTQPTLTSTFGAPATVHAVRLIWRDIGLDTKHDVKPGPFRYRVELETGKDPSTTILDRSESAEDPLIDYREYKPTPEPAPGGSFSAPRKASPPASPSSPSLAKPLPASL